MAMIFPIVLLVLFAIIELGVGFRDYLSISNAAREGARVASAMGDDANADCIVVQTVAEQITVASSIDNLQRMEIFRANASGNQIPSATNIYTFVGTDPLDCGHWSGVVTWPAATRNVVAGGATPLDIVGVRLLYTHSWLTGFPPFSGQFTINESTISRLEPEEYA
jgi:Flp pilus assembly protein TadG